MLSLANQYFNMIILYLALTASLKMLEAGGATHIVGDSDGWTSFTNSLNWSQEKQFHVGDVLVFNYKNDEHNVMQVNSTAYGKCIKNPYTRLFNSGHDLLVLSEVGKFWYICAVADHCENGQRLAIKVVL